MSWGDGVAGRGRGTRGTTAPVLGVAAAVVGVVAVSGCSGHGKGTSTDRAAASTRAADPIPAVPTAPTTPPLPSATAAGATTAPAAGHVVNGVHSGDLRAFFLPVPDHAVPVGDPDGEQLAPLDVGSTTNAATATAQLKQYRYRTGYSRDWTAPGSHVDVTIRLARFGSPDLAAAYFRKLRYSGTAIRPLTLDEPFPVVAEQTVPGSPYHELFATTYQGDVQVMVRVVSTTGALPPRSELTSLLEAQYQRLRTGH